MSLEQVEELLGRKAEVVEVIGGYVVEYFNFNTSPPPLGITPMEACSLFVEWYKGISKEELPHGTQDISSSEETSQDEGA